MTIVVTGATGHLGRLVVESLLHRGARPEDLVATGRDTARLDDLAARGVQVRTADYDDPESLDAAFAGADKVLLVSGNQPGVRRRQHQNAIDAAKRARVGLVAYTSIANADTSTIGLAEDHRATERALAESGLPYTVLRNSWYLENYTAQLPVQVEHGAVLGSAGEGRISGATRADYADAAAAVLLGGPTAKVYELGGDAAFTLTDLAAAISDSTGRAVRYQDLPVADYAQALVGAGLPEAVAAEVAGYDVGIASDDLLVTSGDLSRLIGRPTTPMPEAVRQAAAATGLARSAADRA